MRLADKRKAIHPLLNERLPADAQAAYYAFYHPDEKTQLVTMPAGEDRALGYVCLARTGIDLFRPLITLRLPLSENGSNVDPVAGADLIEKAIPEQTGIIVSAPIAYRPLLSALIDIHQEQILSLFMLDRSRFEPIINVLVTYSESFNGWPRYVIHRTGSDQGSANDETVASAGLNWQSPSFAEIYVHTKSPHRRQGLGRSVVASIIHHLLERGRTPLYVANADNEPSIQLAESVGFVDTGIREILLEGTRKIKT